MSIADTEIQEYLNTEDKIEDFLLMNLDLPEMDDFANTNFKINKEISPA